MAAPIPIERVQELAGGIASAVQVSYASGAAINIAQAVVPAETKVTAVAYADADGADGTAFYVIDRGSVGGYVVMTADDRLDPVIVIAPTGEFDFKPGTPLYDMLCQDIPQRLDAAEKFGAGRSEAWSALLDGDDPLAKAIAYDGVSYIKDVRVEPLVQSKWGQSYVDGKETFNYYTPNNYVCGCVATAGSQIMRYHSYPDSSVTVPQVSNTCYVDGSARSFTMTGGTYDWNKMPLVPDSSITLEQRQAIGKLCFDVGISIYMSWSSGGSGAGAYCLKDAFRDVFKYRNAIAYQISRGSLSSEVIERAFLANFDAACPVELGITSATGAYGHSIVADGYGYTDGRLYVHLNFGWRGSDDAWYNLPNIGTGYSYSVINGVVYNIFPRKSGDLLTGRVLDAATGEPIANATVQAFNGSSLAGSTKTSSSGIYALTIPGGKTYSVIANAAGAETSEMSVYLKESVSTGTEGQYYYPGTGTVGNSWGNDFLLAMESEPVVPDIPTGVSASDGTSTAFVHVTWRASAGATSYEVWRATSNSSSAAARVAGSVTTPYYDDISAVEGTTYWYWVKASNSSGTSGFSASDSGHRAYEIPAAPTGVSASDGTSSAGVVVSWNAVAAAASYTVWRSATSLSADATQIASGITSTTYTDTSAASDTDYWYWVRAVNKGGGMSAFSASDKGSRLISKPSAPTGVSATDGYSSTEIVVTWNSVATAASYSVYRATTSSPPSKPLATGLTSTSYSDASAAAGTTYYYWVKAVNAGGTSDFSSYDTGRLASAVIVGPKTVSASDGSNPAYIRVSWEASQGASSYEVWRGTVNAYSLASRIATSTATSCDDSTATPGALYWYWVRAVTSSGTSSFSSSDSGYRPLSVPTGVSATTGRPDGVMVSWPAVNGATSYEVGRGENGASAPSDPFWPVNSLSYKDTTAVPGVSYVYFVRAKATACTSGWSTSAAGSRSVPVPEGLDASEDYTDRILVTWPSLAGATAYELMRSSEDDIASADLIATTTDTTWSDRTAEYGLVYYYFLRAKFSAGTSVWSTSEPGCRAFPAPTGVSATQGSNATRVTISWDAIEGATLFQVWRYSPERARDELVGTSTTTSYNDSKNIEAGRKYKYRVMAVFPTGTSKYSSYVQGYLKSTSPVVSASDGTSTSQISLSWSPSSGAVAYQVFRSTTSAAPLPDDTPVGATDSLTCQYTDSKADAGVLYYYWIRTVTPIDKSDFGSADTGYRGLPGVTRVTATDGTYADKVVVSWVAVKGAQSYEIWRGDSDDSGAATRVARNVKETSWEDTAVTPGQQCWYWVRAFDVGVGFWGASDSGWRKLSEPMEVTATTNQTDGVKVAWKGTTSGVSFEIKRGYSSDFAAAVVVATVSDKSNYTDVTAVPGYAYYYWVHAYSELDDESDWSGPAYGFRAVSAPTTVAATDGTSLDAVTVTWSAATSAKRYEIWRNTTTKTDTAELIGTTNKLVWVDTSVVPGVAYYYWIKSISALDTSAFSGRDVGYVSTSAPTGVTATDGAAPNYVRVSWTEADGALSYAVWRAESEDDTTATQLKTGITALEYDDTAVVPGKFYWYWVRPVSAAGPGVFVGPDNGYAALSAPTDVVATSNDLTRVTVSWRRSNGAVSYELFRAETNDVDSATNEVFATMTALNYADTNAFPAVKYWYWVRAVADADISPLGGPADGFRLLSVPTGIAASDGTSDEFVKVSWNETVGAESYEVWRAANSTSTSAATFVAGVTNELEYLDSTAEPGISYTYWLKAVSELYTTGFSANDKGWRSLPAPASVMASDGTTSDGVIVEWSAVPGAVKYEVWRCEDGVASTNRVFASADATVVSYTDTSAKAGTLYRYWVRTVALTGTGVFGLPDVGFRAVAAPTNLKATDGSSYDYVRITWNAAAGAESYEICRTATNELHAATTNLFSVTGTTFDDTNAVPGIIYGYSVRTIAPLSTSSYAGPDDGYRKFRAVTDLVASDGTSLDAVDLFWTSPTGAVKYMVWRSTGNGVNSATIIATVDESTYTDTAALHGVRYWYWVNAVADVEGEKGTSNDGWRALVVPENVQATDGDSTSHTRITWTASPDATMYEIRRGTTADTDSMSVIKTLNSPSELVFEDTSGTPGVLYYYAVRAGGTGGWSAFGDADTGYKALMPPTGVSATDGTLSGGRVAVTWNKVTGASYYQVWKADSDSGEKKMLSGWLSATSYTDTSVKADVKYWYYVVAAVVASADPNEARQSAFSGGDSGYAKEDGTVIPPVDFGGGITWPVVGNANGSATTNAIAFSSVEGGHLTFSGVEGAVGSTTAIQALVKTSLDSDSVYTAPATLKIVSEGKAELDLNAVWGTRPALFIIGITTEQGEALP